MKERQTWTGLPDLPDTPNMSIEVGLQQETNLRAILGDNLWKAFEGEKMKCRPVFDIPLMTREQLALVEANLVDRTPGIEAANRFLESRPHKASVLIPIGLIFIMLAITALVWGRV